MFVMTACTVAPVPMYYSKSEIKDFANQMFNSPTYTSNNKNGNTKVYNFTDEYGRPFTISTRKHNLSFFKPEDIPFLYDRCIEDTYSYDIFVYESENIADIVESYGYDYIIDACRIYILLPYEYHDNSDKIADETANMLMDIQATLNLNMDSGAIGSSVTHMSRSSSVYLIGEPGENYLEENPTYDFSDDSTSQVWTRNFAVSSGQKWDKAELKDSISQSIEHFIGKQG